MSINITQLLLDIKTHVVNTVKNDLEDKMKLFINDLIENNKIQINKDSVVTIKKQLEGKDPLEILKLSKKFISKEDWVPAIGKKPEFMALVELKKNPDAGNKKPSMETVQTGGDLDSTIDTASQTIGDAIKIAPQPFVAAFERYVKTYESANLKLPQDPTRQVSDAILALVNTAVQTRRQNTIDSLIAIANEGTDSKDSKMIKADSFRGTVKMKIEEKIINESLQPWDFNENQEMNIIMNGSFSQEVKKRVIENNLIHKSYGNNPQVTATIDRYFDKLEKVGSKSDPKVKNDPIRNNLKKIGEVMGFSATKEDEKKKDEDNAEVTAEKQQEMNQKAIESLSQTLETIDSPKNKEIIQILKVLPPETTVEDAMVKIKEIVNDPAMIEMLDAKAQEVKTEMLSSEEFDIKFKENLSSTVSKALEDVIGSTTDNDVEKRAEEIKSIMGSLNEHDKVGSIIDTNNALYIEYKNNVCQVKQEGGAENDLPKYCISNNIIEKFIEYVHTKVELQPNQNVSKSVVIDFRLLEEINNRVNPPVAVPITDSIDSDLQGSKHNQFK